MLVPCFRFVKYKLADRETIETVKDVGSAYAHDSMVRGVTITFRVDIHRYDDFLNLMEGWEKSLVLPSAIDRAQFQMGSL